MLPRGVVTAKQENPSDGPRITLILLPELLKRLEFHGREIEIPAVHDRLADTGVEFAHQWFGGAVSASTSATGW